MQIIRTTPPAAPRIKTPALDERRTCAQCGLPFRCPIAQIERFTCGPCA